MPQYIMPGEGTPGFCELPTFVQGYITCMCWTECHADNPELEDLGFDDIAESELIDIIKDCETFLADPEVATILAAIYEKHAHYDEQRAGHDFWLTRNGHGAGFWDRGLGKLGDSLAAIAKRYNERSVYKGDDGKLYLS